MNPIYSKGNFNNLLDKFGEVGYVKSVTCPIFTVDGIPSTFLGEVVMFEDGALGHIISINSDSASVLSFFDSPISVGTRVARTGSGLKIPVGNSLLGKSMDPLGRSLYDNDPLGEFSEYRLVENKPPGIEDRVKIDRPLETGVSVIDMLVPLGMGQRELIIGDRKTGKTNFLLQTVLNQSKQGTICIYAAIGKKKADVLQIDSFFKENNIKKDSVLIASSSTSSAGLIYLTPYTAMSVAEFFKDSGRDVVVVLDDLSSHAIFYREVSLLAGRFPGRNSYPGDIFHTHARLVERAGNFKVKLDDDVTKTVSITCLPVAETKESNISGYIQTNLMSMTDGHIYFDGGLFDKGRRPSVNYFLSVTRVGRQTQSKVRSGINRELSNFLSLYEKTQSFVHFGAELSSGSRATLRMGDKILDFFNQSPDRILSMDLQAILFCLIWVGVWNDKSLLETRGILEGIIKSYEISEDIRVLFKDYVEKASTFNDLLGNVSSKLNEILSAVDSVGVGSEPVDSDDREVKV